MTWVIGASTMFGYGVVISDVCVTFSNGRTRDMLQKIYPVGNFIVAGFSGSVQMGFMLLQDLQTFLTLPAGVSNSAWHPDWVAEEWCSRARRMFAEVPASARLGGSEILMAGVSPDQDIGIPGMARSYVSVLKAPDFSPEIVPGGNEIRSIGSGASVDAYKEALRGLMGSKSGYHPMMQAEVGNPGGWGHSMMISLSSTVSETPAEGISKHLQVCMVGRNKLWEGNSDTTMYPQQGAPVEIKMPPVARGYAEFLQMAQEIHLDAEGVVG